MALLQETLPEAHTWWRIADHGWTDPLDPTSAQRRGGRWDPPESHPTLYLNEDQVTARLNLRHFTDQWPYQPEDLRDDTGPILVAAHLPRRQVVCDAHSRRGVAAAGLPVTYPYDKDGQLVAHSQCQKIGVRARRAGLRGVRSRTAQAPDGARRKLAWFPASPSSVARRLRTLTFHEWYWA